MFGSRALPGPLRVWGCVFTLSVTGFAQLPITVSETPSGDANTTPNAADAEPQDPTPSPNTRDPAAAEALFRSGRQLLLESKPDEALAKFEESYRLDPTAGALFNQAECKLKQGKTASAWALYQQAATLADVQGKQDLFELATARANLVSADLSYITFHVGAPVPGLQVLRDGVLVGHAQFDVTLPIDPGRHSISARAPGYVPLEMFVVIGEKRDRKNIVIQRLKLKPLPQPPPPTAVVPPPKPVEQLTPPKPQPGPWLLAGAGASALLIGSVAGLLALQENSNMNEQCPSPPTNCGPAVIAAQGRRDFEKNLSWVTIPVGLAAIGGAITWLALTPPPERQQAALGFPKFEATLGARNWGLNVAGVF